MRDRFVEWGKQLDDVLVADEHLPFLRRLNVLSHKLKRAQAYLSLHSHARAR